MKKSIIIFALSLSLILTLLFSATAPYFKESPSYEESDTSSKNFIYTSTQSIKTNYTALNYKTVKAIWISQFDISPILNENGIQHPIEDCKKGIEKLVENITSLGINTVFFQLRPNADSLYPSEIFPTSKYLSGSYLLPSEYDAFELFLEYARKYSLSVHAWINPLRCMKESEIELIDNSYKIKQWYNEGAESIKKVNGILYLNPAHSDVRNLICLGIKEIMQKYTVDGIHIDDYFYPTVEESFDIIEYSEYKEHGGILSLGDFRREQINTLIREIYATVKNINPSVLFGVSPSGNIERNYGTLYADVELWCKSDAYIDYLCPQIYFGFEHETLPFDTVCSEFSEMTANTEVKLIMGLTLHKAYDGYNDNIDVWAGVGEREWIENRDIIARSIKHIKTIDNCKGAAFFSYQYFFNPKNGEAIQETADELSAFLPLLNSWR